MLHGRPNPRKTLTLFDPVTLPILASAYGSCSAAVLLANVSGKDVPSATSVMAVISDSIPREQPRKFATSPTRHVTKPIMPRAKPKQSHPCAKSVGGMKAKSSFHGKER